MERKERVIKERSKHTLIWFGIAFALSIILFVVALLSQVSPGAWVPLLVVSPRQVNFVDKFDRLVQTGVVSYINEFNETDMVDAAAVAELNQRYSSITSNAAAFKNDCPEKDIVYKQDEFYQEMLLYEKALSSGNTIEMTKRMETSERKVYELIELLKEYGYKV